MKKPAIILLLLALAGCNEMMQDAPKVEPRICGNAIKKQVPGLDGGLEDGKALFQENCATCHNPLKDATGPALKDALQRWNNDTARLHAYIRNPVKMIKKDKYVRELHKKWKGDMTAFPDLSNEQIDAIFIYSRF